MRPSFRCLSLALVLFGGPAAGLAGTLQLPLEFRQDYTTYNLQSVRGVPISTNTDPYVSTVVDGVPTLSGAASDGRMPISNESAGSHELPNAQLFRGFISYGAVTGLRSNDWATLRGVPGLQAGNAPFSPTLAIQMKLPTAQTMDGYLIMRRAQVGAPYLSRQISFLFGSLIAAPATDENGVLRTNGLAGDYWLPQPYFTTNMPDVAQGYYWSPNAKQVYAIQSGPINVTWVRAKPASAAELAGYTNVNGTSVTFTNDDGSLGTVPSFTSNGGNSYLLYTARYLVSSSPVKPPQKMYWTENAYAQKGYLVSVLQGNVGAVHIVYNSRFPATVATNYYTDPNYPNPPGLPVTNTFWYTQQGPLGTLHAYNIEGRVFMELLGEPQVDGSLRSFGFEIVDVYKEPIPTDVVVQLGGRVPAYQNGTAEQETGLVPSPTLGTQQKFFYRQTLSAGQQTTLYATFQTTHPNDFQAYWLKAGVGGIQWPFLFNRYEAVWPSDPASYVQYVRPLVGTEAEARQTSVQLPATEAPQLPYQDPLPSPYGAKVDNGRFYTYLSPQFPAHRSLLQFTVGDQVEFERVFSWLDVAIRSNAIALAGGAADPGSLLRSSVATNLSVWDPETSTLNFTNEETTPRYVTATVNVADRVNPPEGELGAVGDYWAGYLQPSSDTSYNPGAYQDPFAVGFVRANQGAIIPVNAIPGRNTLDVLWFRSDHADTSKGFQAAYWPAVLGHYTVQWPEDTKEIILASNDGSGPLDSLQAKGSIYRQNDPTLPGYNPNEEHALMLGGQAYALRDDLNVTNRDGYTSGPFVLLDYLGADGRPAMRAFHVRREAPEAGVVFDYVVDAGKVLQGPMPLPLLEPPVAGSGPNAHNFNSEPPESSGDLPVGWNNPPPSSPFAHYARFTFEDRTHNLWVYRGLHAGLPALEIGAFNTTNGVFNSLPPATAVRGVPFQYYVDVSRRPDTLDISATNLPDGLRLSTDNGVAIVGIPSSASQDYAVTLTIRELDSTNAFSASLPIHVTGTGTPSTRPRSSYNVYEPYSGTVATFADRIPSLAQTPTTNNSFTMEFYYKTQPTFDWPSNPPPVGSIVPYLLPRDGSGDFAGDPSSSSTPSLKIVYRPQWPSVIDGQPLPQLYSGETLTSSKRGMTGVRGQSSVRVLYEQSIALDFTDAPPSVVLYDPTVQKTASLTNIGGLPPSVVSQTYLGRVYFPNLPPNLKNRLYYDPTSTNLVFQGQFIDQPAGGGHEYLLLNVLRGADLEAARALCSSNDLAATNWDTALANLSTPVYTFSIDTNGNYVRNDDLTVTRSTGDLVEITNENTAVDSYALSARGPGDGYVSYIVGNGLDPAHSGEPVSVAILKVVPNLYAGELHVIADSNPLSEKVSFQHSADLAGNAADYLYEWRIEPPVDGQPPTIPITNWAQLVLGPDLSHYTLAGSAGIQALSDNYVSLRYRSVDPLANPASTNWSAWTKPELAEGWIKRVLGGINPFNQRTSDLFNNPVNTTASIIAQAGHRWEGNVALNLDTINNYGLIEIYETVLNRGKDLSINSGINYGPANDALLLAAGYLNDLYMLLGNEAWADAANPTIGIGTADKTYGNIATALFAFKGQEPSLLEEELALLRGRDDFLAPGVESSPVYNRLFWNYTRGIDAGEVIYALNYNILDQNNDGVVDASDAAVLYPQGHGDAYGHYLTALTGYYSLLMNPEFDWVPRIEAVTVLGNVVSVDYQDERKFAGAAAALATAGRQVFDLTWREAYQPGTSRGWAYFDDSRTNSTSSYQTPSGSRHVARYWGLDHWATRVGQGAYLNWLAGNAILPPTDPDPAHQGIQKVDRTTVPELAQLPATARQLQTDMDNAEAGFTPLGLSQNSVPFDINPFEVTGANPQTHFEQIYQRAVGTLNNAVVAFNDAQNVTQLMRSEQDSLDNYQAAYTNQETAYLDQLIQLYGTPYPDDIGPGHTYKQGYAGPDLIHYTYVENPDVNFTGVVPDPTTTITNYIDIQNLPVSWSSEMLTDVGIVPSTDPTWSTNTALAIPYVIGPNGFFDKPSGWTSRRQSPGQIQQAISELIAARNKLRKALAFETYDKQALDKAMQASRAQLAFEAGNLNVTSNSTLAQISINNIQEGYNVLNKWSTAAETILEDDKSIIRDDVPVTFIFGTSDGGDVGKAAVAPLYTIDNAIKWSMLAADAVEFTGMSAQTTVLQNEVLTNMQYLATLQLDQDTKTAVLALGNQELTIQGDLFTINEAFRELDDKQRAYQSLLAQGQRIQQERLTFRQHAAALIQGYRTRDAAFRIFLNEKLERYKTLFDLAAQYSFMAAQAYDYETGLLDTDAGRSFVNRIISARSLGVVDNGQPQYAGSDTGDPGLSSALAEMKADWDVLKGRLGFNNPDGYGTTVSLRNEDFRILAGSSGDDHWRDVLQQSRIADLRTDSDVMRYCSQIDDGSGQPVPGIVLSFSTLVAPGRNLFGQPLAPGDHNFSPSLFATKIFAAGVDFDGYVGMDNPSANSGAGGVSPPDPTLDPNALAATPYIYLIPVGTDSMRSPPLGDSGAVRSWNVEDVTIPLPFNIGASDLSAPEFYTANDSLTEPLFSVRKHQAFRPVSTTAAFTPNIFSASGQLQPSQFTNRRLIGRSIWNSRWKLVIPGATLLSDPNQGLDRFIQSVKDIKLYFVTYSYAGN